MNNDLTLFEQLVLWLCRNKLKFTIGHDTYNNRVYIHGNYTFRECSPTEICVLGTGFYYSVTNVEELRIMFKAIVK